MVRIVNGLYPKMRSEEDSKGEIRNMSRKRRYQEEFHTDLIVATIGAASISGDDAFLACTFARDCPFRYIDSNQSGSQKLPKSYFYMSEQKLEYFLRKMPGSECEAFRLQLAESRRKKDQILEKLLRFILEDKLDLEAMYASLYPDKPFSAKQMRNLRSDLFQKLSDFLAVRLFESSPEKHLYLARALNRIGATRYFPAVVERYESEERKDSLSLDLADMDNRLKEEEMLHQYAVNGRQNVSFDKLLTGSEEAFVARMLYHALADQEAQRVLKASPPDPPPLQLWPSILERLEAGAWADSPLIRIYYALYRLVTFDPAPSTFAEVKSSLTEYGNRVTKSEAIAIYTVALNYGIRILNSGDRQYLAEVFHLYREMLDRSLLVSEKGISPWHFKSIATIGIRLQQLEWVEGFIERNHLYLAAQFRENLLYYCRGMLAYASGDFPEAESYMNKVLDSYTDPFFGLDARSYLLRIYYEMANETGMEALKTSFRLFLRRHRHLGKERLGNYQEFIRFFRRLHALNPGDLARAKRLYEEIKSSPHQANRDWLLQKLDAFLPKTGEL